MINQFAKSHSKLSALTRYDEHKLDAIEALDLSWCKILSFHQGTLGGWVSENCLAMARLLRWFYGPLRTLKEPPPYVAPTTVYTTWNVKELKQWLISRGKSATGLKPILQA